MAGKRVATSRISKDDPEGAHASSEGEDDHGHGHDGVQAMSAERRYLLPACHECSSLIEFLVLPSDMCPVLPVHPPM